MIRYLLSLLLTLSPADARTQVDEAYQREVDKLDPMRSVQRQEPTDLEDPLPAAEEGLPKKEADEIAASDLLAPLDEDEPKEEIFLINADDKNKGQERLTINPEMLKHIKLPEEEPAWWEILWQKICDFFRYLWG